MFSRHSHQNRSIRNPPHTEEKRVYKRIGGRNETAMSRSSFSSLSYSKDFPSRSSLSLGPRYNDDEEDFNSQSVLILIENGYTNVREIASGMFGTVFEAVDEQGRKVAIKVETPSISYSEEEMIPDLSVEELSASVSETSALAHLKHPNIVQLFDSFRDTRSAGSIITVMENASMDLRYWLRENENEPVESTANQRVAFAREICCGLSYVHKMGLMHLDLKPANILLVSQENEVYSAKLADFGMSSRLQGSRAPGLSKGASHYRAPELTCNSRRYSEKADIWSLGVVLLELLLSVDAEKLFSYRSAKLQYDALASTLGNPSAEWIKVHGAADEPCEARPSIEQSSISSNSYRHFMKLIYADKSNEEKDRYWQTWKRAFGGEKSLIALLTLLSKCFSLEPKSRPSAEEIFEQLGAFIEQDCGNENECQKCSSGSRNEPDKFKVPSTVTRTSVSETPKWFGAAQLLWKRLSKQTLMGPIRKAESFAYEIFKQYERADNESNKKETIQIASSLIACELFGILTFPDGSEIKLAALNPLPESAKSILFLHWQIGEYFQWNFGI